MERIRYIFQTCKLEETGFRVIFNEPFMLENGLMINEQQQWYAYSLIYSMQLPLDNCKNENTQKSIGA